MRKIIGSSLENFPRLWVKSYPFPKEVLALADLASQDIGMEIFLGGNFEENQECVKICRDSYPRWGVELFCYQGEEKRKAEVIYDPLSPDRAVRELSRSYLFNALDLALKYGASHLQLDGNDGYRTKLEPMVDSKDIVVAIKRKKGLLLEIREQFGEFPIYFENTIPIDLHAPSLMSLTGHRLSDFWKQGLPLEYDLAHHALALDIYTRAHELWFPLTEEETSLGQRVKEVGITGVILEDLALFPEIYFAHLSNAARFSVGTKSDITPEDPTQSLIDLVKVIPVLIRKARNITPEVEDKEYIQRPNLRQWIKKLQDYKK